MSESAADTPATTESGNARPYSVSELAFALKRTLEDAYGFVRLRGELSKVTHHSNGHVYLTLKDDRAAIDGVVWKGQVRGLSVRPEQGLEVVVTGKITAYPAGSRYQIVIETIEAAGVGALLAQLERLKAKLPEAVSDTCPVCGCTAWMLPIGVVEAHPDSLMNECPLSGMVLDELDGHGLLALSVQWLAGWLRSGDGHGVAKHWDSLTEEQQRALFIATLAAVPDSPAEDLFAWLEAS